ncbi:MAG: hypothetical protein P8Y94_06920 [Acidobacteriota bacterium]
MLRRLISGLSLWIAVSGIAWAQQEPAGATGTLKGFVMDLGSGSTLHGAVIEIQPGGATILRKCRSMPEPTGPVSCSG